MQTQLFVQGSFRCAMLSVCGVVLLSAIATAEQASSPPAEGIEFFESRIRPVLIEHCYSCHSGEADVLQGNLRVDFAGRLLKGGDSGPAIVAGEPDKSLLLSALRYESFEMPPTAPLPESVINDFETWIRMGAPDPRSGLVVDGDDEVSPPAQKHWSFTNPERPRPPQVKNPDQSPTAIDAFILARLETAGLSPSPRAEPRTLVRRLYYDLTGLPPSAEEVDGFAANFSEARYVEVVDRLMASPRFGERWARYWLDVARYADTKGYVFAEDRNYPNAYKYRDWVIGAFNNDLPFDKFLMAQLAADQLDDPTAASAMGFLTLGRRFLNDQTLINDDRIDLITRGLMGLTVSCARCHDHKYDPVPTADYYSLFAVLANSEEKSHEDNPPTLADRAQSVDQHIYVRGNPGAKGPVVQRQFLSCLSDGEPKPFVHGSGRLEMAQAVASRDNPLTARVWVNRVWGHLFGQGLVATPSDFGTRGQPPTHPELLDWLATTFMDDGWSTKGLIRRIVLSNAYRQASDVRNEAMEIDPENLLVWRMNRRRLDLEAFRDTLLASAGRLDLTVGGPSVQLTTEPYSTRRSVYGFVERQNPSAFFRTFDFANPNAHSPARPQTTSPHQALYMLNSPFAMEQARYLAKRAADDAPENYSGRIRNLYLLALGRAPSPEDMADADSYVLKAPPADAEAIPNRYAWRYGWGVYDQLSDRVKLNIFPAFVNNILQGGQVLPDPQLGWAMLSAEGGHPGDAHHQVIRRWIAPVDGTLTVEGRLEHGEAHGDGVRGRLVLGNRGKVGEWIAHNGHSDTNATPVPVAAGETVDFVVDCLGSVDYDTFKWPVNLQVQQSVGSMLDARSVDQFSGEPAPAPPLDRWESLAHVLLMSNELMFLD